ncbi:MAG: hypothetical protein WD049_06650 [Candidatus Paceibacterota bacterium]
MTLPSRSAVEERHFPFQFGKGSDAIEMRSLDELAELHAPLVLLLADCLMHFSKLHDLSVPSFSVGRDHGSSPKNACEQ